MVERDYGPDYRDRLGWWWWWDWVTVDAILYLFAVELVAFGDDLELLVEML